MKYSLAHTLLAVVLCQVAPAAEFYVAPSGNDTHPGTQVQPFASMNRAQEAARAAKDATVILRGGTYQPEQPLVLTPADSGTTYRAFPGETPVIIGARKIEGWRKLAKEPAGVEEAAKGKLWVADIPPGWRFHYLFVDGAPQPRAKLHNTHWRKWPVDFKPGERTPNGQRLTFSNKAFLQHLPSNGDVEMVCIMAQYGVMGNGVLTGLNPQTGAAVWNSKQTHLGFRVRDPNRYTLENAIPFIDQPGEWCVDSAAGKVYFWPATDTLATSTVLAPKLHSLIRIEGEEDGPRLVEKVRISGLTLAYTDRLPENQWNDRWVFRQWEHPDAMVFFENAQNCVLENCRLLYSGASGVSLNQHAQGIRVDGNEIAWPGSNGVLFSGYGPGKKDVNRGNRVTRNYIHNMGQGNYWHSNAIQVYQSGHNHISENLLQRSAYSCVSLVGAHPNHINDARHFFKDHPEGSAGDFNYWSMFHVRVEDFPREMQEAVRAGKKPFNRENIKPYLYTAGNVLEYNIVVEPEQLLDEGGAIYAYCTGKGNIWRNNLVYKSSGMPGSSILALDDIAEYFTITGNVIWMNGVARCGTIGMRPTERGNVIKDNIRAAYRPDHADGRTNVDGIKAGFYTPDATRDPVYKLEQTILERVKAGGGWPGNPDTGIPRPGEEIKDAVQRTLPRGSHMTIE